MQPIVAPTRRVVSILITAAAALAAAGTASANCGWSPPAGAGPAPGDEAAPAPAAPSTFPGLMPAVYHPDAGGMLRVSEDFWNREPGIVGTWRFTYTSDGSAYPAAIPYGATVDFGLHQWHSDNTEIFTSGARPPSTGDICMGVWKQVGLRTFTMKHIALAWVSPDSTPAAPKAAYLGPAIIRETVTLNHAKDRYEGTFTLDQYASDEVTLLEHIAGKVTATRFDFD